MLFVTIFRFSLFLIYCYYLDYQRAFFFLVLDIKKKRIKKYQRFPNLELDGFLFFPIQLIDRNKENKHKYFFVIITKHSIDLIICINSILSSIN